MQMGLAIASVSSGLGATITDVEIAASHQINEPALIASLLVR
jgi:hypothetical protein